VPSQYGIDDPLPSTYVKQLLHPFKGAGPTQAACEEVNTISRRTTVPPKMDHNGMEIAVLKEGNRSVSATAEA
jgi:hypothetical protein